MTKESLIKELRKYLMDNEFLTKKRNFSKIKIENNISRLPFNIVRDIDSVISFNWYNISYRQRLSEDFIREFQDKVAWDSISDSQNLSEKFIREFQDKVYWGIISANQILSEDFIRKFQDRVNWGNISRFQNLSENFILENLEKIDFDGIRYNTKIKKPFKDKTLQCYYELNYMNKKV
jgi:hypothetical protein